MLDLHYVHVTMQTSPLRQLPGDKGVSCTQPTTYSPGLAINIAALITAQEQGHTRNLIGNRTPLSRVQLPDLALRAARPSVVKDCLGHARLDQTRANGIDANTSAGQLIRTGLRDGHNRCLGRRVIC